MNELLAKLSTYNLFNYLLPGVIFAAAASKISRHQLIQKDVVTGLFIYYFLGLVISRFGSLVIEPLLKRTSFVRFANYADFVTAARVDPKIEILSEANNTYRTLCSLLTLLLLLRVYSRVEERHPCIEGWTVTAAIGALLVMFLFSYRKQTSYITKRVTLSGGQK